MGGVFGTNIKAHKTDETWQEKPTGPMEPSASQEPTVSLGNQWPWRRTNDEADGHVTLTNRRKTINWRKAHRQTLCGLTWSSCILIYGNILRIMHKNPTRRPYLPRMERHHKISETLIPDLPYMEKSLLSRDLGLLLATI